MANHLILKNNIYHVRLDIPSDVKHAFGNRKVLTKSLKTGNKVEANALSSVIVGNWKHQIINARSAIKPANNQWITEFADMALEAQEERETFDKNAITGSITDVLQALRGGIKLSQSEEEKINLKKLKEEFNTEFFKLMNIPSEERESYNILLKTYADYSYKYFKALEYLPEKDNSQDSYMKFIRINQYSTQMNLLFEAWLISKKYSLGNNDMQLILNIKDNASLYTEKNCFSPHRIKNWESFLQTQLDNKKTISEYVSKVKFLSSFLLKNKLQINFDSISSFLNSISNKAKTRSKYLSSFRNYWSWAILYDPYSRETYSNLPNPFEKHILPRANKRASEPYKAFSLDEISSIINSAIQAKDFELAIIIIYGLHTGCRLEEIGRITVENTVYDKENNPIGINIEIAKTEAGKREIPLHNNLIQLHKLLIKTIKNGYLFKGGNNKNGNRLDYISKRFGKLKSKLGYDHLHVFHSIRKTFTTELHNAGYGLSVAPYILGHKPDNFTLSIYSDGVNFALKLRAIESINNSAINTKSIKEISDWILSK